MYPLLTYHTGPVCLHFSPNQSIHFTHTTQWSGDAEIISTVDKILPTLPEVPAYNNKQLPTYSQVITKSAPRPICLPHTCISISRCCCCAGRVVPVLPRCKCPAHGVLHHPHGLLHPHLGGGHLAGPKPDTHSGECACREINQAYMHMYHT